MSTGKVAVYAVHALAALLLMPGCHGIFEVAGDSLHAHLFTNYTAELIPTCIAGNVINITLDVALRQIVNLDEKEQVLSTNVWLRMDWKDRRLRWDPALYNNVKVVYVSYKSVWVPDLVIHDFCVIVGKSRLLCAEEQMMPGKEDFRVKVRATGDVHYKFPTLLRSICRVDVTNFPFDRQTCELKLGSWSYNTAYLDFYQRPQDQRMGILEYFAKNNAWIVEHVVSKRYVQEFDDGNFSDITYTIYLKRRHNFYVITIMFPSILVSIVAAVGFLLPPESGEKVSLEVTVLLSQAVFLLLISDFLPPSSDNMPILGLYFAACMILVSLSLALAILVLNVHHRGDVAGIPLPVWLRALLLRTCPPRRHRRDTQEILPDINFCTASTMDISTIDSELKPRDNNSNRCSQTITLGIPRCFSSADIKQDLHDDRMLVMLREQLKALHGIQKHLADINTADIESRNDINPGNDVSDDVNTDDKVHWRRLARVLDRIFLGFYLVCFAIVTLIFIVQLCHPPENEFKPNTF
ncbi:neuronal acetylcholine receptor subunit alpha-10-like [Mya arenaria]|uniref:neuronal acetylcholine receptor subunit alpha-10-like n=1 Tax=Mya arenaria TaxID=6604 RepID=UPI0022E7FEBA|nr:neuronal acetylcholine receptor subunit alpha-10-like [Mya arenaria]